jgi:hypothetical protein
MTLHRQAPSDPDVIWLGCGKDDYPLNNIERAVGASCEFADDDEEIMLSETKKWYRAFERALDCFPAFNLVLLAIAGV